MNLANLKNAREQLKLAGSNYAIESALEIVETEIRKCESEQAVAVPTVEAGQVWVNLSGGEYTVLYVGKEFVFLRHNAGAEELMPPDLLTSAHTLKLPVQNGQPEPSCNPHPDAQHGFNRSGSHSQNRYVCDCEGWVAPESTPLTADDVSESVWKATRNAINRRKPLAYNRDFAVIAAAAITAYLAEKEKESGNG